MKNIVGAQAESRLRQSGSKTLVLDFYVSLHTRSVRAINPRGEEYIYSGVNDILKGRGAARGWVGGCEMAVLRRWLVGTCCWERGGHMVTQRV